MSEIQEDMSLPFSQEKQEAVLGHMMTDPRFFALVKGRLSRGHFLNTRSGQIWEKIVAFEKLHSKLPTAHELKDTFSKQAKDDVERLSAILDLAVTSRIKQYSLEYIGREMANWLKAKVVVNGLSKFQSGFNNGVKSGRDEEINKNYKDLENLVREINDISFDQGVAEDMSDPYDDIVDMETSADHALAFGDPKLDGHLLPMGNGHASLLKGDMTILLAPTNIGKTTTMITVACHNIIRGKDVLFIAHEGRPQDLRRKVWRCLMGVTDSEASTIRGTPALVKKMEWAKELVTKHFQLVMMIRGGTAVEDVEATVRQLNDQWRAKNGKGFDMLIDDYPAKLTTNQASGGQFAFRQIQEVVYNRFTAMALEHDMHVLVAIQTNREGSKINKKTNKDDTRLLGMEDVMEAWGPMTTATNVITINRDQEAMAKSYVRFHICKSRSSETGFVVTCRSNYGRARSHGFGMSSSIGRVESDSGQRVSELLDQSELAKSEVSPCSEDEVN